MATTSEAAGVVPASFQNFRKVVCPVPAGTLPYYVTIQVSNDKSLFSNSESMLVYDSTCWGCSQSAGCIKKVNCCL